jgi:hypothetical protein
MWDLLWTEWHWDRFVFKNLFFPLSVSFHQCLIFIHHQHFIFLTVYSNVIMHLKKSTSAIALGKIFIIINRIDIAVLQKNCVGQARNHFPKCTAFQFFMVCE